MTLPNAINDREYQKFVDVAPGETAVRVILASLAPSSYDRIDATYPSSTEEVYTYSLSGVPQGSIAITYVNSSKKDLLSVVKS